MKKGSLLMFAVGASLCALMMAQATNGNTKSITEQVPAAAINGSNDAATNAFCPMTAVSSPSNCNINLATVKNAQVQVAANTAARSEWFTGPLAAILQTKSLSPPRREVALVLVNSRLPNLGVAFFGARLALHQSGQTQGGLEARASSLVA